MDGDVKRIAMAVVVEVGNGGGGRMNRQNKVMAMSSGDDASTDTVVGGSPAEAGTPGIEIFRI